MFTNNLINEPKNNVFDFLYKIFFIFNCFDNFIIKTYLFK